MSVPSASPRRAEGARGSSSAPDASTALVVDTFDRDLPAGRVIGSAATNGVPRAGVDEQAALSIDNGALRIAPLLEPGWGRASLSYGPYKREPGLTFAVNLLNGHNTAQVEHLTETLPRRLERWLLGSEAEGRIRRLRSWIGCGRLLRTLRQFRWWWNLRKGRKDLVLLDENLAMGWFEQSAPTNPVGGGSGFVMHAAGPENGELWANVAGGPMKVLKGVMNVPLYLVVVLRERGAAYYAASVPTTPYLPSPPFMRPLAINDSDDRRFVHPVISQSTIGQIGFRLDTRVYAADVTRLEAASHWCGTAHAADRLTGSGALESQHADVGGQWTVFGGTLIRSPDGVRASESGGMAILRPTTPTGLIHARMQGHDPDESRAAIVLRCGGAADFLCVEIDPHGCRLMSCESGSMSSLAVGERLPKGLMGPRSIHVTDWNDRIECHIDGVVALVAHTTAHSGAIGVGIRISGASDGVRIADFEAHPAVCSVPTQPRIDATNLRDGTRDVVHERFDGPERELDGKISTIGGQRWSRLMGSGRLDVTGRGSARVRASAEHPNPGRTAYTVDWSEPGFVDLEMEVTPPGRGRGQKEYARAGFILWQDSQNYATFSAWNSDVYGGASFSSFFHVDGFEDLYDAVWSNVASRIWYGRPVRMRLTCDGHQYLLRLDGEPILYRKFRDVYPNMNRLTVRRVGIVINWEWGNDTGSLIRDFVARSRDA